MKRNVEATVTGEEKDDEAAAPDLSADLAENQTENEIDDSTQAQVENQIENQIENQLGTSSGKTETSVGTLQFEEIQVVVKGLDEKFTSTFIRPINGFVTLTATAEQDVLETLEKSNFTVSIDASKTDSEGEQKYSVLVEGPPDVRWKLTENEVTLRIELA